jgi:hypothetical protein
MLVGEVVWMFFVILMGCHLVRTVIYLSASKAQNNTVFAANKSRCCECNVAPTIILCFGVVAPTIMLCDTLACCGGGGGSQR